jgi:hypothetical protein
MSEAKSGAIREESDPGYRFAHPGYDDSGSNECQVGCRHPRAAGQLRLPRSAIRATILTRTRTGSSGRLSKYRRLIMADLIVSSDSCSMAAHGETYMTVSSGSRK